MLEEFQNTQPIAFKVLSNALNKKKYAHAYIFEDNSSSDANSLVMAFIKDLLTTDLSDEEKTNIIAMIDSGNHPEVKRITSDSLWIKKDQIKNLQNEFSKKPIIGNKKIYIIEEAEKLNKASSNTILKFLEEPEEGIIAILITKNVYQLLETVKSRCQTVKLINSVKKTQKVFDIVNADQTITEEEKNEKLKAAVSFIHFYEKRKIETICFMTKMWHNYFNTKELTLLGFDLLILYYKDVLNYKIGRELEFFNNDIENIDNIFKYQSQYDISNKIALISRYKEKIKLNSNLNLLMDKLIIELEGGI